MAGVSSAIALGLAGVSAFKSFTQKAPDAPAMPSVPSAPKVDPMAMDVIARQAAATQRRRAAATPGLPSTILTGPAGVQPPAPVAYKSLLGQ